jgi:alpha-tubulin suppressor-like RCC1 family protein
VVLKSDGTVVAVGLNIAGQCYVGSWMDIIQIVTHQDHTVGLRSDGPVVAAGLKVEQLNGIRSRQYHSR